MIGIYKITNPIGNSYIGQSRDIEHRFYYYRLSSDWINEQRKLYNSLKKYGYENHFFEVIEECSEDNINEREIYYAVGVVQNDIQYFLKYKNQLKKYSIDNRVQISKVNMNKIFIEIENITLHIIELKNQEQEFLKLLDKIYYGKHTD